MDAKRSGTTTWYHMVAFAAAATGSTAVAPASSNLQALRKYLGLSSPSGAESFSLQMEEHGLSPQQKDACRHMSRTPLTVLDCIAGTGKTKVLTTFVASMVAVLPADGYIAVVAPHRTMAARLVSLLREKLPHEIIALAGVHVQDKTANDLLLSFLEEQQMSSREDQQTSP